MSMISRIASVAAMRRARQLAGKISYDSISSRKNKWEQRTTHTKKDWPSRSVSTFREVQGRALNFEDRNKANLFASHAHPEPCDLNTCESIPGPDIENEPTAVK